MSEEMNEESTNLEFQKVIMDLSNDILNTFPEYKEKYNDDLKNLENKENVVNVFEYCKKVYPERFFDILYQNNDIWENSEINTLFLPDIDFKEMMLDESVSEQTKSTIWKYLQIILLSVTSSLSDGESFGDTAKLFEAINEDEFKAKLEETVNQMHDLFGSMEGDNNNNEKPKDSKINLDDLPNPEDIHNHITGMLDGKLGRLAREIAQETAENLDIDMEGSQDVGDVFKKLFSNPGKLMNLVKDVGGKLDAKIKSGDINEEELLSEATNIMQKMKDMPGMPGMDGIQEMLSKMGMPKGKMNNANMNKFKSHMERQIKLAKMKEKMKSKSNSNTNSNSWSDGSTLDKTSLEEAHKRAEEAASALLAEIDSEKQVAENKKKRKKRKKDKKKNVNS